MDAGFRKSEQGEESRECSKACAQHVTVHVTVHNLLTARAYSGPASKPFCPGLFPPPQLLLFGQFVVNMACLDTRQKSKRKGKLELLFDGADAEEAVGERKAKSLVDNVSDSLAPVRLLCAPMGDCFLLCCDCFL